MNQETFEKEIGMCKEHFNKKKSCKWGECEKCGAIPLLHKLFTGEIVDDGSELVRLREKYLN